MLDHGLFNLEYEPEDNSMEWSGISPYESQDTRCDYLVEKVSTPNNYGCSSALEIAVHREHHILS
jgi:hypothetical protein